MSELDVEGRHLRSRLADTLFGRNDPARIGRFVVIDTLGQGGMGSVYLAYDPQLDRKVAVKVLSRVSSDAQEWMLREATTLARLNHPNVVTIHEVGEDDGEPFVAMEYVDGGTLRQWCLEHPEPSATRTREVLEFARQALAGLRAAHALGVVHRDLKPANMLLGADGRLRLADFGLARSPSLSQRGEGTNPDASESPATMMTVSGTIAGTPAYMAPEQFEGKSDERSDQFGFCVTFFEALHGVRPFEGDSIFGMLEAIRSGEIATVPGVQAPPYVRRVLERGLSARPEYRYPNISALGSALEAGERHRRFRIGLAKSLGGVAFVAAGVGGVFGYQHYRLDRKVDACALAGDAIDEVWNEGARQALRAGMIATKIGDAEATADRVMPWIDAQTEAWREQTTLACMNTHVHETWGGAKLDKATWCLEDRRLEIASLVAELAKADEMAAHGAMQAATNLSPIEICVDEAALAGMATPPGPEHWSQVVGLREKLSRARFLQAAGNYEEGLEIIGRAQEGVEQLGWPPLSAALEEVEALSLNSSGAYVQAEAVGISAYMKAARAGSWDVAFALANGLVFNVGVMQARFSEGKLWGEHAMTAIAHGGDPLGLHEAALAGNLGSMHRLAGNYDEAWSSHTRALEIREEALGPAHPSVAMSLSDLGNVLDAKGESERGKAMHERALAIREEALGPGHIYVATSLNNLAVEHAQAGELEEARALFSRSLAIQEEVLGAEHPKMVIQLTNLGSINDMMGEREEAKRLFRRALAIADETLSAEHPTIAMVLGNLGALLRSLGELGEARVVLERALAIQEETLGADHPDMVRSLLELGFLALDLEDANSGLAYFERVAEIDSSRGLLPSRRAEGWHGLALSLWRLPEGEGRDGDGAREFAIRAREYYATQGELGLEPLAKLEALLVEIGPRR